MKKILALLAICGGLSVTTWAADETLEVQRHADHLRISYREQPIATYVFRDERTPRPYFKDLATLSGKRVTRNHPPQPTDAQDHPLMHPGVWLAFGDLNGQDYWRLKTRVEHRSFVVEPHLDSRGSLVWEARSEYLDAEGTPLGTEHSVFALERRGSDWLLRWDATLSGVDRELIFGDQEEMGLGVRVATELAVQHGGRIRNSLGGLNEKGCWGQRAAWCDYGAVRNGDRYGIATLTSPENFKTSTFHVRDYGLMLANSFAEKAFGRSTNPARTIVPRDQSLTLSFGILVYDHAENEPVDVATVHEAFVHRP